MGCFSDGAGAFVGYTVTDANFCSTEATNLTYPQTLIRTAAQAPPVTASLLKFRSGDNWNFEVDQYEAPNAEAGAGHLLQMRFGSILRHEEMNINFEWPWDEDFNLGMLVGTEGTFRATNPDGTWWEGLAKCVRAPGQPNRVVGEESVGVATWRWTGVDASGNPVAPDDLYDHTAL